MPMGHQPGPSARSSISVSKQRVTELIGRGEEVGAEPGRRMSMEVLVAGRWLVKVKIPCQSIACVVTILSKIELAQGKIKIKKYCQNKVAPWLPA